MKGTILILEDDLQLAVQWRNALISKGYTLILSERARDALALFSNNPVDLCIIDFLVRVDGKPSPDGGLTFLGMLDASDRKKTKILGVSGMTGGYPAVNAENHFLNLGAHSFLGKPFTDDELVLRVEELLNQ